MYYSHPYRLQSCFSVLDNELRISSLWTVFQSGLHSKALIVILAASPPILLKNKIITCYVLPQF